MAKFKVLKDYNDQKTGDIIELDEVSSKDLIASGQIEEVKEPVADKPEESTAGAPSTSAPSGTAGV
jgi:hypothetical protein